MLQKKFLFVFLIVSVIAKSEGDFPLESVMQKGHSKSITCYDFSPDNSFVVTGSSDNTVILWNLESGLQIRTFSRHSEAIRSVRYSPDGSKIITASSDNSAKVFELISGKLIRTIKLNDQDLDHALFSPDGQYIILSDKRDGLCFYSMQTGRRMYTFSQHYGQSDHTGIIDPENKRILSTNNYASFLVCDLTNGDTLKEIPFDKSYQLSFSPNGKYIAASSSKLFTQVFDAATYKLLYTLADGDEQCDGCNTHHAFTHDGNFLLTVSSKVDAVLWDLSTGKKMRTFSTLKERPTSLEFSKDDAFLLVSFDDHVFVYDTKTGKEKMHLTADNISYFDFNINSESTLILVPGINNEAILYDISSGRKRKSLEGYLNKKRDDGLRFDANFWSDQRILKYIQMKREVALSPDGSLLAIGNVDSTAILLNTHTGKPVHYLSGHSKVVIALAFSPDGNYLATAGGDRVVVIWDVKTGKMIHRLKGHQELIFDLAFNSDGTQLISGSWDGSIRLWDLKNPGDFTYIDLGGISPYTVGFTKNDLYILSGDLDRNIHFWEADAGTTFRTLIGHTSVISGFEMSSDGTKIVTASWDGKVKLWDVLTGMLIGKMNQHEGAVYDVCFDPKGEVIASASADNQIILWNPATGKMTALSGHTSPVTSVEISKDGTTLWSGDASGTIKCWELKSNKELFSRIQISRNEWLSTSPDGSFDGSSKSLNLVNYVTGFEVIPVGSLFDKYYTPDLINKIMSGEKQNRTGENLHQLMRETPVISYDLTSLNTRSGSASDSIIQWKNSTIPLDIRMNSQGQSLDEIRIYNNGKLVLQEPISGDLVFRGADKDVRRFEVALSDGENKLTTVAVNSDRTESNAIHLTVNYDGVAALTDLFILSIGINTYQNPQYNLEYAVNDAQTFVKSLTTHSDSLFNKVSLFEIYNDQAIKSNIVKAFQEISEQIGPEDVFIFYYAGHGVMSLEQASNISDFFIVTHDVTNLYGESSMLREKAVSATELMDFSVEILAQKQLFILDACHSGGALDAIAMRGDGREKALAQLARSTGTFFITAAQNAQYANEVGDLSHGLFTYALLEVLNGEQGNNGDNRITVSELKVYVEDRVPELAEKYRGSPQYPTSYGFGQDFPIVLLK